MTRLTLQPPSHCTVYSMPRKSTFVRPLSPCTHHTMRRGEFRQSNRDLSLHATIACACASKERVRVARRWLTSPNTREVIKVSADSCSRACVWEGCLSGADYA